MCTICYVLYSLMLQCFVSLVGFTSLRYFRLDTHPPQPEEIFSSPLFHSPSRSWSIGDAETATRRTMSDIKTNVMMGCRALLTSDLIVQKRNGKEWELWKNKRWLIYIVVEKISLIESNTRCYRGSILNRRFAVARRQSGSQAIMDTRSIPSRNTLGGNSWGLNRTFSWGVESFRTGKAGFFHLNFAGCLKCLKWWGWLYLIETIFT